MQNEEKEIILNETHRPDGSLATRIIRDNEKTYLVQYDRNNTVSFMVPLERGIGGDVFGKENITYKDGQVATIITEDFVKQTRVITQYDDNGNITVSQDLGENDIVNFKDGYIQSIIKYSGDRLGFDAKERDELHYGENGVLLSSNHQTQVSAGRFSRDLNMWTTTQQTTYYPNGKINTVMTYAQIHNRIPSNTGQLPGDGGEHDATVITGRDILNYGHHETDSYVSSLVQYSEDGKLIMSVKLNEMDEINYYSSGRVCSILRKNKEGKPSSLTSYDQQGNIANEIVYDNGRIVSSTDFVDGRPVSNTQQGDEEYQNIFAQTKGVKSKNITIINETRNKQCQIVTRTFEADGKKYIDQYDSKSKVILHVDLAEEDKIIYDDEGRIKTHIVMHGPLFVELVEYDVKGKEKRRLNLKTVDDHAYATSKTKSFEKGVAKTSLKTNFEKDLQDLFFGYLIINTAALLESCMRNPNARMGEDLEKVPFPGPIAGAKNNLISNIETWKNKASANEDILKMKSFVLSMDWGYFAAQHKSEWHPAYDTGIRSYLPHLNGSALENYKDKGWKIVEKAYKTIDRAFSGVTKIKTKQLVQKERD